MFISNIPVYTFISNINTFAQEISGYLVWLHVHKSTLSIFNNEGKNGDIQAKISIIQACILKLKKNIPPFKVAKKYINAINMAVPLTIFYGIYHFG